MAAESVVFLHDKVPCMSALATQALLKESNIDFFANTQWPGNSPDLNPTENLGAIIKDRPEAILFCSLQPGCRHFPARFGLADKKI